MIQSDQIRIQANAHEFRRASLWLTDIPQRQEIPADVLYRLDLCMNEALANILAHGGDTARSEPIDITLQIDRASTSPKAVLRIVDAGFPFDGVNFAPNGLPSKLEDATPGGLGLQMLRAFSDLVSYRTHQNKNELTLVFHWATPH